MAKQEHKYTQRVVKNTIIFFLMSIAAGFIAYLVRLLMARNLTKAEYGLFYGVFALYGLLSLVRDMGLGPALIKHIPEFQVKKQLGMAKGAIFITFGSQFIVSLFFFVIFFLFANSVAFHLFHDPAAVVPLRLLAIMFLIMPFEKIISFTFQGFQRIDYNSMVEFVRMSFVLVLLFIMFKYNTGIAVASLAYVLIYIIQLPVYIPFLKKTFPTFGKVKAVLTKSLAKKLFLFGFPVMFGIVGSMILTYTDTLMLSFFTTAETVASYQVAMPTAKLMLYFGGAISMIMLPLSSELWERNLKKKLAEGIKSIYRYSFALVLPLTLLMIVFPKLILIVMFGAEYADAALALQILAAGAFIYSISIVNSNILSGIGMPKQNMYIILVAAGVNIIINFFLIPKYMVIGASIATMISYVIILLGTSWYLKRMVNAEVPWLDWSKTLIAGVLFVLAIFFIREQLTIFSDIVEAIITVIISGLLYLVLLFLFKVFTVSGIRYLIDSAMKRKN